MLSYEKSREMKELGYPQELEYGDWYYDADGDLELYRLDKGFPVIIERAVKVPTTDGMWDGLAKYIDKVDLTYVGVTYIEYSPQLGSLVTRTIQVKGKTADALEQALCELWKKVFGAKQEE